MNTKDKDEVKALVAVLNERASARRAAHGGNRPGAGRPQTLPDDMKRVEFQCDPDRLAHLDKWAKANNRDRSSVIRDAIALMTGY